MPGLLVASVLTALSITVPKFYPYLPLAMKELQFHALRLAVKSPVICLS
jgi:hypothetical protein